MTTPGAGAGPGSAATARGGWGSGWDQQAVSLIVLIDLDSGFSGLFGYSPGAPADGNLIFSIAAAAGQDPEHNPYVQGFGSYGQTPGGLAYSQMIDGQFNTGLFTDNSPASLSGGQGEVIISTGTSTALGVAGLLRMFQETNGTKGYADLSTALLGLYQTPDTPSLGDSGLNFMTLAHGWTDSGLGVSGSYRLVSSPGNSVQVIGDLDSGTQADGTVIATLPGAYTPVSNQPIGCTFPGNAVNAPAARLSINNAGQLQCAGISAMAAGQRVTFNAIYSLDAV